MEQRWNTCENGVINKQIKLHMYENNLIILLLLNKNSTFQRGNNIIRALRRFGFFDLSFIKEMENEKLLIHNILNQEKYYSLTEKAKVYFKLNELKIRKDIKTTFSEQIEFIDILFSNIEY
jgi:hypothetical protein